jgi:excisionase family DNA binding protein
MPDNQLAEVLTLTEAAAYLRVPEEELLLLAERRDIPAQRIGTEWRFLKRAIAHWLTFGSKFMRDSPHWLFEYPILEEFLLAIETRLLARAKTQKPDRGSKEAVSKHVGVFEDEGDLEETLATLSSIRTGRASRSGG